jgi:hypothetical protein
MQRGNPHRAERRMATTFTQFLLEQELASLHELEEASQATVLYGGRLGTSLIELGVLTPEQLDAALARHHGLPEIPKEWLARPDAAARAALHVDLVKRHRAFPLNFEKRSLHVGLVDPRNEAVLDDLAFASGCLIVPYALTEFRFVQLLKQVYAVAPSTRFKNLLDEGVRARAQAERTEARARAKRQREEQMQVAFGPVAADLSSANDFDSFFVSEAAPAAVAVAAQAKPLAEDATDPLAPVQPAPSVEPAPLFENAPALEIDGRALVSERRSGPPTLEQLEQRLAQSPERGVVIATAAELAARFAEVAALFVVRDGVAAGLAGVRAGQALELEAAVIPLAPEHALGACAERREPQRVVPGAPLERLLAKALQSPESAELAAYPVVVAGRVVNLLVAQPRAGALARAAHAALSALAPQIGLAYERLIREQKQRALAAPPAPAANPAAAAAPAPKASIGALPLRKRVVKAPAK